MAFYGTPAFQNSLAAGAVPVDISADPNDPEVLAIAAFLRVLNALENIRSSINVAEHGRTMTRPPTGAISPVWRLRKPSMRWKCCPQARWPHIASLPSARPGQFAGCQGRARSGAAPAGTAGDRKRAECGSPTATRGAVRSSESGDAAAVVSQLSASLSSTTRWRGRDRRVTGGDHAQHLRI